MSTSPFPAHGPSRGATAAAGFLREHLTTDVRVDLTRKQIARDQITWTVRAREGSGRAEARFNAGRISSLRLGSDDRR